MRSLTPGHKRIPTNLLEDRCGIAGYIVVLLLFGMASAAYAQVCEQMEGEALYTEHNMRLAADQWGPLWRMRTVGFQGIRQCPNSEVLWYTALRSAELLGVPDSAAPATLPGLVAEAVKHVPTSARILTVAARVTDSPDLAREAVALGPHYRPAKRALAVALVHTGKMQEALRLCQVARPSVEDDLTCTKVLLDGGHTAQAVIAARKAITSHKSDLIEPTVGIQLSSRAEELLGSSLIKAGRRREAIHAFQLAAAEGSVTAQHQLDSLKLRR